MKNTTVMVIIPQNTCFRLRSELVKLAQLTAARNAVP